MELISLKEPLTRKPLRSLRTLVRVAACLVCVCIAIEGPAAAALDSAIEGKTRAATFEVVVAKPVHDSLTYEKPLPLELVPFVIRNDRYIPIGTAFAIGPNRFVTAAHVLRGAAESSLGYPLVRGTDGKVRGLKSILAFSSREDFGVFSVQGDDSNDFLEATQQGSIGSTVYAVGNALGEGIVIRDGLLTSETPEERNGDWKWMRFSAAASPGNSGGPLLDSHGRAVAVVLGKSPNENLNFALPIERVLHADSKAGHIDFRQSFRLPIMSAAAVASLQRDFPLPQPFGAFASEMIGAENDFYDQALAQYLQENAKAIFPEGNGSEKLLTTSYSERLPSVITQQDDGTWDAIEASGITTGSLAGGGAIQYGKSADWTVVQLRKPDDVSLKSLFSDSKLYMDLVLQGLRLDRHVGDQAIRITSLGTAKREEWLTDAYGRKWQLRVWPLEFMDYALVSLALPKPDGCAALMLMGPSGLVHATINQGRLLANLVYTSYAGPLRDWKSFLAEKPLIPEAFDRIEINAQYDATFQYVSPRIRFSFDENVQDIKPDSWLTLAFSYFRDGGRVVWDVSGVDVSEDHKGSSTVSVSRRIRPPSAFGSDASADWAQIVSRKGSYDGRPHYSAGSSWISGAFTKGEQGHAPPDAGSTVVYCLTYSARTVMEPAVTQRIHDTILTATRILE
jgi:serine protease Do